MSVFPGDMNIGWGFGLEADEADCRFIMAQPDEPQEEESQPTDPLLAVSELEQRVNDLEERLRSLTIVVNDLHQAAEISLFTFEGLLKRIQDLEEKD